MQEDISLFSLFSGTPLQQRLRLWFRFGYLLDADHRVKEARLTPCLVRLPPLCLGGDGLPPTLPENLDFKGGFHDIPLELDIGRRTSGAAGWDFSLIGEILPSGAVINTQL
ncbi:hypothetical protein [Corynebacterium occultum]|uniref:hypothetical protein n=1 Tax=Corynebacterium occultum TaxID=2675219 RepID=UPI0018CCD0C9|nr:hypothetical protein [Corynebacterium occultum]